jgi:hypothetical protein
VDDIVLVILSSALNDVTVLTRLLLPAIELSSEVPIPEPTPIANIVIPLARAAAAASPGAVLARPSVSTTSILCALLCVPLKTEFCTYVIASPVLVPLLSCTIPFTALITASASVPSASRSSSDIVLLYCTMAMLVSFSLRRKRRITEVINVLHVEKSFGATEPEPSTKNTSSVLAVVVVHVVSGCMTSVAQLLRTLTRSPIDERPPFCSDIALGPEKPPDHPAHTDCAPCENPP